MLHNDAKAIALIETIRKSHAHPYVSIMTHIELDIGIVSERHKQEARALLASFYCQELTMDIAKNVSKLLQPFAKDKQRKAQLLPDAIIAATAKHLNADICTANIKDFRALSIQDNQIIEYKTDKKQK